ncbi:hypothetical protein [Mariniblastus fucicola]|uniref:Uncharacterized protein n=1 Tax=Mariniblastus fucicola TaxID=980251 RepID=A0A5B9PG73_9BACT|nr:hypothetical protein [Mariniblastus fucicola]QEG23762.1 hypothetical protein MFFC18_36640 [Mariniblastus fucicola]
MIRSITLLLLLCTLFAGCGEKTTSAALNKTNLSRLKNCYSIYLDDNAHVGPKDKEEFVNFLLTDRRAIKRRKRMEITDEQVESMFMNPRDGQEFKVKYGVEGYLNHAIIFEAVGVDGMRIVALDPPQEVDAETYDKYWTGKIKAGPMGGGGGLKEIEEELDKEAIESGSE